MVIYKGRLLIGAIIGDDVPVFLLITGFFMFQKGDISIITYWKSKLGSFLKKIWIPSIFLVIITCVLTPIIEKANTLSDVAGWVESIKWDDLYGFLLTNTANGYCGHLWYICFYLRMLVFLPILCFVCREEMNVVRRVYLSISLVSIFIKDLKLFSPNILMDISSFAFEELFTYILLGYEIYIFCKKIRQMYSGKIILLVSFGMYAIGVFIKMELQMALYRICGENVDRRYMGLYCLPAFLTSSCLLIFFSNLTMPFPKKVDRILLFLGKKTMLIYLFHMLVICFTDKIRANIAAWVNYDNTTLLSAMGYYILAGSCVFIISLLLAVVFDYIYNKLCNFLKFSVQNLC